MKTLRNRINYHIELNIAFYVRIGKVNFLKYEVREKKYYIKII